MNYKIIFAKRLIELREKHNLTQQQLADKLQITRQSLSLYEKAERTINIDLLAKIADVFEVTTDYLLGRSNIETMDNDIIQACNVIGLNEEAVNSIKNFARFFVSDDSKDFYATALESFEVLVNSFHFIDLLIYMTAISMESNSFVKLIQTAKKNKKTLAQIKKNYNQLDYLSYKATQLFDEVLKGFLHPDYSVLDYIELFPDSYRNFDPFPDSLPHDIDSYSKEVSDNAEHNAPKE